MFGPKLVVDKRGLPISLRVPVEGAPVKGRHLRQFAYRLAHRVAGRKLHEGVSWLTKTLGCSSVFGHRDVLDAPEEDVFFERASHGKWGGGIADEFFLWGDLRGPRNRSAAMEQKQLCKHLRLIE